MKHESKANIFNHIILIILCFAIIAPFIILVSASFSDEMQLAKEGYGLLPRGTSLEAYKFVFKNPRTITDAYAVTIFVSTCYTLMATFLMACVAYPLTKSDMVGRNQLNFYFYFSSLFGGGLIPMYILLTQYLHLNDTLWVYLLPHLISPWYIFMMRTFFKNIPGEISESAYIDGANEYTIFFKIIIPLSKPVLATVALMMFLAKWNSWMDSMLYMEKERLMMLQYQLQRIMNNIKLLQNSEVDVSQLISAKDIPGETARMAMAVVAAGPALCIFPFFQKYFVKGLTVGSVKG